MPVIILPSSVSLPDMVKGSVGDMACLGVTESFQVKRQVLLSAAEAAEMILRVDNVLKAAPRYFFTHLALSHFLPRSNFFYSTLSEVYI